MDKTTDDCVPRSLSVDYPPAGGDGAVRSYSPLATMGTLCRASGRATPPGPGWQGVVKLIIKGPGTSAPTGPEWGSAQPVSPAADGRWPSGVMPSLGAWIAPAGSTSPNNTLYAKAFWYNYSSYPPQTYEDGPEALPFRGVYVSSCASAVLKVSSEAGTTVTPAMSVTPFSVLAVDACPTGGEETWLEYRNLAVDNLVFGNRLMLGDRPLRASLLAVSAFAVGWWRGDDRPRLVRRAQGDITVATDGWLFKDSPEAALIVWQQDLARRHVLVSEDRTQADVVDLDPSQDIYVQVNYPILDAFTRRGGFSLWVKVIA